jgi:hypothetical protein
MPVGQAGPWWTWNVVGRASPALPVGVIVDARVAGREGAIIDARVGRGLPRRRRWMPQCRGARRGQRAEARPTGGCRRPGGQVSPARIGD